MRITVGNWCSTVGNRQSWDYSLSVTDARQKALLLRIVEQLGLADAEWEPLDAEVQERDNCRLDWLLHAAGRLEPG